MTDAFKQGFMDKMAEFEKDSNAFTDLIAKPVAQAARRGAGAVARGVKGLFGRGAAKAAPKITITPEEVAAAKVPSKITITPEEVAATKKSPEEIARVYGTASKSPQIIEEKPEVLAETRKHRSPGLLDVSGRRYASPKMLSGRGNEQWAEIDNAVRAALADKGLSVAENDGLARSMATAITEGDATRMASTGQHLKDALGAPDYVKGELKPVPVSTVDSFPSREMYPFSVETGELPTISSGKRLDTGYWPEFKDGTIGYRYEIPDGFKEVPSNMAVKKTESVQPDSYRLNYVPGRYAEMRQAIRDWGENAWKDYANFQENPGFWALRDPKIRPPLFE